MLLNAVLSVLMMTWRHVDEKQISLYYLLCGLVWRRHHHNCRAFYNKYVGLVDGTRRDQSTE